MEGKIEMDAPDTNVKLDVTVVVRNCSPTSGSQVEACDHTDSTYCDSQLLLNSGGQVEACDPIDSTYYHSQFLLNFIPKAGTATISDQPSMVPSMMNEDDMGMPSMLPVVAPSLVMLMPTSVPTVASGAGLSTSSATFAYVTLVVTLTCVILTNTYAIV